MLNIPSHLSTVARQLPRGKRKRYLTTEEKIQEIKVKFGLTHGKGKRKKKGAKKK